MSEQIIDAVKSRYGATAASGLTNDDAGVRAVAEAFGYTAEELAAVPAGANMGLSRGNPTATAALRPGEVVVDPGSGGGLDVFLAAGKVGPTGKAIGIDMTPEMLVRARTNAGKAGLANVEFREGTIDKLPLPDASADCIISNCVINLAPDKDAVFREMFRVLKPGGRVALSDIALKNPLPSDLARGIMAYVGCIGGALPIDDFERRLRSAGFDPVRIMDAGTDLNAYKNVAGQSACCSPPMEKVSLTLAEESCRGPACRTDTDEAATAHQGLLAIIECHDLNEYAASVKVYALKPRE